MLKVIAFGIGRVKVEWLFRDEGWNVFYSLLARSIAYAKKTALTVTLFRSDVSWFSGHRLEDEAWVDLRWRSRKTKVKYCMLDRVLKMREQFKFDALP